MGDSRQLSDYRLPSVACLRSFGGVTGAPSFRGSSEASEDAVPIHRPRKVDIVHVRKRQVVLDTLNLTGQSPELR